MFKQPMIFKHTNKQNTLSKYLIGTMKPMLKMSTNPTNLPFNVYTIWAHFIRLTSDAFQSSIDVLLNFDDFDSMMSSECAKTTHAERERERESER